MARSDEDSDSGSASGSSSSVSLHAKKGKRTFYVRAGHSKRRSVPTVPETSLARSIESGTTSEEATSSAAEELEPKARPGAKLVTSLHAEDEIERILTVQKSAGLPTIYLCKLEDGRKVKLHREALSEYPDLLEAYERRQNDSDAGAQSDEADSSGMDSRGQDDAASSDYSEAESSEAPAQRKGRNKLNAFIVTTSDEEAEEESDAPRRTSRGKKVKNPKKLKIEPSRRSSRSTRHQEHFVDEEDVLADMEESASSDDDVQRIVAPKKARRSRVHEVIDLEEQTDVDDEGLVDVSHLNICASCWQKPSQKKRKKSRKGDWEDTQGAGAWITCGSCSYAYHFGCLPRGLQADISRTLKQSAMEVDGERAHDREWDQSKQFSMAKCPPCSKKATGACLSLCCKGPKEEGERLYRCTVCIRAFHYGCLSDANPKTPTNWYCDECFSLKGLNVDVILAWRPLGTKEGDAPPETYSLPSPKDLQGKAEYLVKYAKVSYQTADWVSHGWLASTATAKLRHFIERGPTVDLNNPVSPLSEEDDDLGNDAAADDADLGAFNRMPDPSAKLRIPQEWLTIDRILKVEYAEGSGRISFSSDDPTPHIEDVERILVKWRLLPYKDSTWDTAPSEGDEQYESFVQAYAAYVRGRRVRLPKVSADQMKVLNMPRPEAKFQALKEQPSYIRGGTLKDFQLDGTSWLYYNWWKKQNVILADEMGLGKTVQIIAYVSVLFRAERAFPFLCVVPNSTLANWLREFEKWAPREMVVVPYYGDEASRKIIEEHEMLDNGTLKAHCIVTTFETIMNHSLAFRKVPRFESLIIDEGQRLKAGSTGKLFNTLSSLTVGHKIILSGTPLNNNLSELFNLLSFLDPENFKDLLGLKERYETLDAEKVAEVQQLLKPHFLRRTKEAVLDLPPLQEIIVPLSLRPLQKRVYKDVLRRNLDSISSLFAQKAGKSKTAKKNFTNILMELRKTACHPFLVAPELEPDGLSARVAHEGLVDASAKLRMLQMMLPKLKARGHRVLIFSQFVIVLNIVERFLRGEGIKFERLDGSTSFADRQRGIDAFNREGSELFAYLLTTRAGGVGINLSTADTVILFDHDWNPFQDLQAISRAHRIGQRRPVTCYKLLIKGSCEEKMLQVGKKKLILEHLVVQRIDQVDNAEDDNQDVSSFLEYGAKAIFEQDEGESEADIRYKPEDIDKLLDRSEQEMLTKKDFAEKGTANVLGMARVWENANDGLVDATDEQAENNFEEQRGFWQARLDEEAARRLQERQEREAQLGRGQRERKRMRELNFPEELLSDPDSPRKETQQKRKAIEIDDEDWSESEAGSKATTDAEDVDPMISPLDKDDQTLDPIVAARQAAEQAERKAKRQEARKRRRLELQALQARAANAAPHATIPPVLNGYYSMPGPLSGAHVGPSYMPYPAGHLGQQMQPDYAADALRAQTMHVARQITRPIADKGPVLSLAPRPAPPRASTSASPMPLTPQDANARALGEAAQARRDAVIKALSVKAAKLKNIEIDRMLADAICKRGKEQTRMLMSVTEKIKQAVRLYLIYKDAPLSNAQYV